MDSLRSVPEPPSELKHLFVDYLSRIQHLEKSLENEKLLNRDLRDKCTKYSEEIYTSKKAALIAEMHLAKLKLQLRKLSEFKDMPLTLE